ncbi:MAG: RNA recognition motif domain-containing protein [Actinomycetota bacterium]
MKIYAGNLSYGLNDDDLREAFEEFGTVETAEVIMDRNTNRSKGFGFVEMADEEEAKAAIDGLDGKELDGRPLKVDKARPKRTESRGSYRY